MGITTDRESRLPKWAQEDLQRLRRRCDSLEKQTKIQEENMGSKAAPIVGGVTVNPYGEMSGGQTLHLHYNHVEFKTKEGVYNVKLRDGLLEVSADGQNLLRLAVFPCASNLVRVGLADERKS